MKLWPSRECEFFFHLFYFISISTFKVARILSYMSTNLNAFCGCSDLTSDKDPQGYGISDSIQYEDQVLINQFLLQKASLPQIRLRSMINLSLCTGARGDELRKMRMCLLCSPIRYRSIGPCPFFVLPVQINQSKAVDSSDYKVLVRHRLPLLCPQFAAFCYFMGRFTLSGEPPPNVTDRISFRENHVFPAQTDKSAPLPADILWKETKALLRALGINTTNVFHAFRKSGIQNVETAGVDQQDLQRFGQWNQNVMQLNYLLMFSPSALLAAGGWRKPTNDYEQFFSPRFLMMPTDALIAHIFPFLPKLEADVKELQESGIACTSQTSFLAWCKYLAVVGYQDTLELAYDGIIYDEDGVCSNPCIRRIIEHDDFKLRFQQFEANVDIGVSSPFLFFLLNFSSSYCLLENH